MDMIDTTTSSSAFPSASVYLLKLGLFMRLCYMTPLLNLYTIMPAT